MEKAATTTFKPGGRVYVIDPGLAQLRAIMRQAGHEPSPNHHGTVSDEPWDEPGTVLIDFDGGGAAPYELHEVRLLTEGDPDAR
jgi:hypothetical protein